MTIIKTLILSCLISLSLSNVFITPAFPPNAFQNQYYIVVFRIRGADFPVFRFTDLPTGLVGASNGTVSGIAKVSGSFSVNMSYVASGKSGWREFILTVTPDNIKRSSYSVVTVRDSRSLTIVFPENFLFRTWQKIVMKFQARSGQQPYVWSFSNIPKGLIGNPSTGQITGVAREQGYYNINIQVADKVGKSSSAFITVNIQPQIKAQSAKALVQVLLQNPQTRMDPEYVKFVLEYTADDLAKAEAAVKEKREIVTKDKRIVDNLTLRFDRANNTYFEAENELTKVNRNKKNWDLILSDSQKILDEARRLLNLSSIQANSTSLRLRESQSSFNAATRRLSDSQKLIESTQAFITTSTILYGRAETTLKSATSSRFQHSLDYKRIAQQLELKRQQLENAKKNQQFSELETINARDTLLLVTQAKDFAEIQLKKMDFALAQSESNLALRNEKMTFTRSQHNKAKRDFDLQKIDFELKLNSLYLAQARKESADRATAFALAEGSLSDHNSDNQSKQFGSSELIGTENGITNSLGFEFKGCDQENYPPISGTSQVMKISISSKSLTILSGRTLVYGDCSSVDQMRIGDWIKFEGYLLRSLVNVVKIKKTSFSE